MTKATKEHVERINVAVVASMRRVEKKPKKKKKT